jgi:hypothetical protein
MSFEYWFNWRVAYIVTLVCCTGPLTHFIVGHKYGYDDDPKPGNAMRAGAGEPGIKRGMVECAAGWDLVIEVDAEYSIRLS